MPFTRRTQSLIDLFKLVIDTAANAIVNDKRKAVIEKQNLPKDSQFRDIAKENNIPRPDLDGPKTPGA